MLWPETSFAKARVSHCVIIKKGQADLLMTVNEEHPDFKHRGETNYAYESGRLQAYLTTLAERVESDTYSAEDYVEKLKDDGILED